MVPKRTSLIDLTCALARLLLVVTTVSGTVP